MASQSVSDSSDKVIRVKLSGGECHIQMAVGLGRDFTGGEIVLFPPETEVSVEGADESSSAYSRSTWASGIASGALYAFRTLRVPRRYLVVVELVGRLRAGDMDALANGAAIAVAKLVGQELPAISTGGWTVQQAEVKLPVIGLPDESLLHRDTMGRNIARLTDTGALPGDRLPPRAETLAFAEAQK